MKSKTLITVFPTVQERH